MHTVLKAIDDWSDCGPCVVMLLLLKFLSVQNIIICCILKHQNLHACSNHNYREGKTMWFLFTHVIACSAMMKIIVNRFPTEVRLIAALCGVWCEIWWYCLDKLLTLEVLLKAPRFKIFNHPNCNCYCNSFWKNKPASLKYGDMLKTMCICLFTWLTNRMLFDRLIGLTLVVLGAVINRLCLGLFGL